MKFIFWEMNKKHKLTSIQSGNSTCSHGPKGHSHVYRNSLHSKQSHDHVHEHGKDHIPSDKIGMALSFICLIHCLVGPLLLILIPSLNGLISHEAFHIIMLGFVVPVAAFSFIKSYKSHGVKRPLQIGAVGLFFLLLGILLPELFGHHHSHMDENLNASTLETAFTVLGGIVLAYAHYYNFKQCQCKD